MLAETLSLFTLLAFTGASSSIYSLISSFQLLKGYFLINMLFSMNDMTLSISEKDDISKLEFVKDDDGNFRVQLESFTGTLLITNLRGGEESKIIVADCPTTTTSAPKRQSEPSDDNFEMKVMPDTKKTRVLDEETFSSNSSIPLGQSSPPDLSQTMDMEEDEDSKKGDEKEEELVVTFPTTTATTPTKGTKDIPTVSTTKKEAPTSSPLPSTPPPTSVVEPTARWGHSLTCIDEEKGRYLLYGGQSLGKKSALPTTLSEIVLYEIKNSDSDAKQSSSSMWSRPIHCEGLARQWHTTTFLPHRQLILAFGGEVGKQGKIHTVDQVMVLDTEIMLWYPPSVSGDIPSGRSGHTASLIKDELVVFGGVKGNKWLNTVSVLDTQTWQWTNVKPHGTPPKHRSYHTATTVGNNNQIVVFGGNNGTQSFNSVHVLEKLEDNTWQWKNIQVLGYMPNPRTGHSATLLSDGKTICIYGGWDPNSDEVDDDDNIFNEYYLLDTEKWTWKKGRNAIADKRVGHQAFLGENDEIHVFGGRVPGDEFTSSMMKFQAI